MENETISRKPAAGMLRHAVVDGKEKYVRVGIMRRRTPLYAQEMEEILLSYISENGVDLNAIRERAAELFKEDKCQEAGMLVSALNFIALFERMTFRDES